MNPTPPPAPSASAHAALPPEGGLSTRPGGAGAEPPSLASWLSSTRAWFDAALDALVPPANTRPAPLHAAMRHSLFAGGKRLRPLLAVAAAEAAGAPRAAALRDPASLPPPAAKLADVVRAHVRRVLALHDGNIAAAARALGVSRSTVRAHST